jgi:hypothetical protein
MRYVEPELEDITNTYDKSVVEVPHMTYATYQQTYQSYVDIKALETKLSTVQQEDSLPEINPEMVVINSAEKSFTLPSKLSHHE